MRRCTLRAASRWTQPVRFNSTSENFPKRADPLAGSDTVAENNVSPDASSPARRYPPLRVDDVSYTPDLNVLASTAVKGSLSSRLAQRIAEQKLESPVPSETTDAAPPQLSQQDYLAARRAERLAREARAASKPFGQPFPGKASPSSPRAPSQTQTPSQTSQTPSLGVSSEGPSSSMEARRQILLARRAERKAREEAAEPQNTSASGAASRFPPRFSQPEEPGRMTPLVVGGPAGRPGAPQFGRGGINTRGGTRGGMRGGMRGGARGGRGRRGGRGGGPGRGRNEAADDEWPEDIAEWLDSGEIHLAGSLRPDVRLGNLDKALRPQPAVLQLDPRAVRENIGGDYSRFVPKNPQQFIAAAKKLGPVKHSSVVLAHSRELPNDDIKAVVGSVQRPAA